MTPVRVKERQAEVIAHLLDDIVRLPGRPLRFGVDPLLGLIPVVGDALATVMGAVVLVIARQLHVPWTVVGAMAYNQLKNGLIGAVPFVGDAYSFYFKSHTINVALLLRAVKHGEIDTCTLVTRSLTMDDVVGLIVLTVPTLILIAFVSVWFWEHNISYVSLFFAPPHLGR